MVRGLFNFKTTSDCMPRLVCEKNVSLLTKHKVYSVEELHSRCDIMLDNYCKTVNIEALTMIDMARKDILPAVSGYVKDLSESALSKKAACPAASCAFEEKLIGRLSKLTELSDIRTEELEKKRIYAKGNAIVVSLSAAYRDEVIPAMQILREAADEAETLTADKYWPFPAYGQLLFGVR